MGVIEFGYGLQAPIKELLKALTEKAKAEKILAEAKTREINTKNGFV